MQLSNQKSESEIVHKEIIDKVRPKMPQPQVLEKLSDFYKVMGDGTRIKILWALEESEMCVCDIAALLDMTKSAVSHQLKSLKNANLVKNRREGKHIYYSLDDRHVNKVLEMGLEHVNEYM